MELINQTKTNFKVGKDKKGDLVTFKIGEVREFGDSLGRVLLRYEGINTLESLKAKAEKIVKKAKAETPKAEK